MISTKPSTAITGAKPMNTTRQITVIKENNMKVTTANLIRWAGVAPMGAGMLYIAIQAIHPLDVFSSVTTAQWAITHYLSIVMDLCQASGKVRLVGFGRLSLV